MEGFNNLEQGILIACAIAFGLILLTLLIVFPIIHFAVTGRGG